MAAHHHLSAAGWAECQVCHTVYSRHVKWCPTCLDNSGHPNPLPAPDPAPVPVPTADNPLDVLLSTVTELGRFPDIQEIAWGKRADALFPPDLAAALVHVAQYGRRALAYDDPDLQAQAEQWQALLVGVTHG